MAADDPGSLGSAPVRVSAFLTALAAGLVLGAFVLSGDLLPLRALVGFVIVAAVGVFVAFRGGGGGGVREGYTDDADASQLPADPQLDTILAGLPEPVIALDREGHVVAFNPASRSLAPALRIGDPISIALRIPDVIDSIRLARSGSAPRRVEFSERAPSERWWEAVVAPLASGDLFLLAFHDLTPIRRVEEMRADFVANASHELRTPLASLLGFVETLQGPAKDDQAARERFLDIMRTQAMRMARLIDDLLSLSRIELNAHVRPDTPVDLVAIVRHVVDALQTLARDRGLAVDIAAPTGSLMVAGDRDELTRLFENLIENALKYGASGKKVDIAIARVASPEGGHEAEVRVRDYGPGIAAEHLPRLTERFYRVDVVESRTQGGTGLGLALVKHILNRHRGRLSVVSKPGEGATFTVRFPLPPGKS